MKDVQDEKPHYKEKIDLVGIKKLLIPVIIKDRSKRTQHTSALIEVSVCLSKHKRGTHMSRFTEHIGFANTDLTYESIKETLEYIRQKMNAESAYIKLDFPYFLEKNSPVSKLKSLSSYNVSFTGELKKKRFYFKMSVEVPVMTLCPCSKEISKYSAHNQRAYVTIEVDTNSFIWIEDLIDIAEESGSSPLYTTLKRPDEKYVTERSYDNPKFVEDVVREAAIELKKYPHIRKFKVTAESVESIHNHSAYAVIEYEKSNRH